MTTAEKIAYLRDLRARILAQQPPSKDRDRTVARIDEQVAELEAEK
jgi:hypothetical protein